MWRLFRLWAIILVAASFLSVVQGSQRHQRSTRIDSSHAIVSSSGPTGAQSDDLLVDAGDDDAALHLRAGKGGRQHIHRKQDGSEDQEEISNEDFLKSADTSMTEKIKARPILCTCIGVMVSCCVISILRIIRLALDWRTAAEANRYAQGVDKWTFSNYVRYRFAHWFTWASNASPKILVAIFIAFVVLGGVFYCLAEGTRAGPAAWKIFVWLVAPDGGAGETTTTARATGAIVSLGGLLIFALVLTLVQDSFNDYLSRLSAGLHPVMEVGHVVLVGFSDSTVLLVQELCKAHAQTGGIAIVILGSQDKPEIEDQLKKAEVDFRGSRLVVRTGRPGDICSLRHVAVATARSVVITADEQMLGEGCSRELRDACAIRTLTTIRSQNWPINGDVVVICSLLRNRALMCDLGGPGTNVVMIDDIVAKLMVKCSRGWGLGMAVITMLGFEGHEFYIRPAPGHLEGKTLAEAALYYPNCVLVGSAAKTKPDPASPSREKDEKKKGLSPRTTNSFDFLAVHEQMPRLSAEDELLILAEHAKDAEICPKEPCAELPPLEGAVKKRHVHAAHRQKEHAVIIGWNSRIGLMLLELDRIMPPDSTVLIYAPLPIGDREEEFEDIQKRWDRRFANVKLEHVVGTLGCRLQYDALEKLESATRIFVLRDESVEDSQAADALTITTVVQIQDVIQKRGFEPTMPFVPEICDTGSTQLCDALDIKDYVSSMDLHAQVLATVVGEPRLHNIVNIVASECISCEFAAVGLEEYMDKPPKEVSFFDVSRAAMQCGDIVLGWTGVAEEDDEDCAGNEGTILELNPADKLKPRMWSVYQDKLMVIQKIQKKV